MAPAVAKAAADSGVARRPIADMEAYRQQLSRFVYHSGNAMQPVFSVAKESGKSLILAEGEDERVLRAAQVVVDERIAKPLLVGRPSTIEERIRSFGLRLRPGSDCEIIDPLDSEVYSQCADVYHGRRKRDGVSAALALSETRSNATVLASILLERGLGDAMLCGVIGRTSDHLTAIRNVIGTRDGLRTLAVMQMLILQQHQLFICDTHCNLNPTAEQVADIALMAASEVSRFGITLGSRCCRIRASEAPRSRMRTRCARRGRLFSNDPPISRSKARCAATRRCRRRCCTTSSRSLVSRGPRTCW